MIASPPLLQARALECQRGECLLFSDVSFDLDAGQILQVGGANGSGKTSLLRIMAGLALPVEGEVLWHGENIRHSRSRYAADMAYFGHHLGLKAELTVLENLRLGMALHGKPQTDDRWRHYLERVGMSEREHLPVRTLSAGQRQRVALARLLASGAKLWILDEPYTALDVAGISLMKGLLEEHAEGGGLVLLTSHQPIAIERELLQLSLSGS